jgi:hypothetical protein
VFEHYFHVKKIFNIKNLCNYDSVDLKLSKININLEIRWSFILMFQRGFFLQLIILLGLLTVFINKSQAKTLTLNSTYTNYSENVCRQEHEAKKIVFVTLNQQTSCDNIHRSLNPELNAQKPETDLDRYFRIAYNAETEEDFDTAIINYHRAFESATCDCDKSHAQAGEQAANEAQELLKKEGIASKPTQFFWSRLQELTQSLSCVTTQ